MMPRNDDSGSARRRRLHRQRGSNRLPTGVFSLFFALFIAGGLYFGYVFVTTVASMLAGIPPPAGISLLPPNPFQVAASSTPLASSGAETTASLPEWRGDERLNILLLGVDQREDERGQPTRTDTMIILTVDPIGKTAAMLHIPRDLWVVIPGHGENKVNTAHFFGEQQSPGKGPVLAKKTIETAFGLRMHYYARVDFGGFEKMIDTIGGITIDAPKAIKDDEYPEGDYGVRRIYIPSGLQRMDGRVALQYARSRHADNDLGRGRRQTQVLLAAKNQAMRLDLIPKLPFLLGVVREAVSTDIPATDTLALANLARQIDSKNIASRSIDATMVTDLYGDGSVLMPRWDLIRPLIAELFADPRLKAEHATIVVQNGTLRDGLATAVGAALTRRGYSVQSVAQAARSDYRETMIIDHTGKRYTAEKLAELLRVNGRNMRREPGEGSDITVVLGGDARVP